MHPILIRIGQFELRTYGVLLFIAFALGLIIFEREARKAGFNKKDIHDFSFYLILSVIVGSRAFYVFYHPSYFLENPLEILLIWKGGLVFYGGLIFAVITALLFLRKRKMPVLKTGDLIAPSIALGIFIGRIGCFFNGCCFGKPAGLPWGVVYPEDSFPNEVFPSIPLHPTQLYESAGALIIFFLLLILKRKRRKEGFIFFLFLSLSSIVRFLDDFLRYYDPGTYLPFLNLNFNQGIALTIFLVSLSFLLYIRGSEVKSKK